MKIKKKRNRYMIFFLFLILWIYTNLKKISNYWEKSLNLKKLSNNEYSQSNNGEQQTKQQSFIRIRIQNRVTKSPNSQFSSLDCFHFFSSIEQELFEWLLILKYTLQKWVSFPVSTFKWSLLYFFLTASFDVQTLLKMEEKNVLKWMLS